MSTDAQISIVIAVPERARKLDELFGSILKQSSAPRYEVLVVAGAPDARLERELLGFDPRFRYLCAGERGGARARNLGIRESKGALILFLDEDVVIDDPQFLKRHWDNHQRLTRASVIGGRFTLPRSPGLFARADFWVRDHILSQARVDGLRSADVIAGNASIKATAVRGILEFDETVPFSVAEAALWAKLLKAGHELHLSDRLTVERRARIGARRFLMRAWRRGRTRALREQRRLVSPWRYPGARLTREANLIERSGQASRALSWLFTLHDLAQAAGYRQQSQATDGVAPLRSLPMIAGLWRQARLRAAGYRRHPTMTELYLALRFCVFRR